MVYPRSRGELAYKQLREGADIGLSPLTRGTRKKVKGVRGKWRFIPAHAGNSYTVNRIRHAHYGLSPLTRGTRQKEPIG